MYLLTLPLIGCCGYQYVVHDVSAPRGDVANVENVGNGERRGAGAGIRESDGVAFGIHVLVGRGVVGFDLTEAKSAVWNVNGVSTKSRRRSIGY